MNPLVIDVHAHIFNALDIPIEGYLRSRRAGNTGIEKWLHPFVGPILFPYVADGMRDKCAAGEVQRPPEKDPAYGLSVRLLDSANADRLRSWEATLTRSVDQIVDEMLETYPKIDLFIPLMIDYEYWFENTQDTPLKSQISNVAENVKRHKGRIHPFVPFDPARELAKEEGLFNPDGVAPEKDGSLDLVVDAIQDKGFIGVKLYNSLGYRPLGNESREAEGYRKRIRVRNDKMQYRLEGRKLDEQLRRLYKYCEDEGVPITAHCQTGGIEAYPRASSDFGEAGYWRDVLQEFNDLRVNLGHFGWSQGHECGYFCEGSCVKDICGMMLTFDNLYADVSHHGVTTWKARRQIRKGYRAMQHDFADGIDVIKQRMLFGTDWHVLKRFRNYGRFQEDYVNLLREKGFFSDAEIEAFLAGNALTFLGLRPGDKNRDRLKAFYEKHGIPEPEWFTETAKV